MLGSRRLPIPAVPAGFLATSFVATFLLAGFTITTAPYAHAEVSLVSSVPASGQTVTDPVTEIELTFSDPVTLNEAETRLLDADGTELIYEAVDDGNVWVIEPALSLDEGVYGVIWQADADDGTSIRGVVRFGVGDVVLEESPTTVDEGVITEPVPVSDAPRDSSGGGFLASLGSALANLGVIVGWGVALFVAFVTTPRMTWTGRHLLQLMRMAGVIAIAGSVIDLLAQLIGSGGLPLILAALLRLAAGVALFVVPGMVNGSPFIWVLSAVVILAYVLNGNESDGPTWLMALADASHVTFAAIWGGGILALSTALAYVIRRRDERDVLIPDGSELTIRFSRFATYSVFGVAITGIVMAFFILPSIGALFSTGWGWLLVIKVALVIALATLGARTHFGAIPEIEYAQVQRDNGDDVEALERSHLRDLRRSLLPSMALVVAILLVSGLLIQASPVA